VGNLSRKESIKKELEKEIRNILLKVQTEANTNSRRI
jgi:vacuolar-type H+-ATPase subunit E/Vma4